MKKFLMILAAAGAIGYLSLHSRAPDVVAVTPVTQADDVVLASAADALPAVKAPAAVAAHELSMARDPASTRPTTEIDAIARFQSESGRTWIFRRDGFTRQIRSIARGQWAMPPRMSAREAADVFVGTYASDLFGVEPKQIAFKSADQTDRTRVTYTQMVDGVAVYGASLNLFFEDGQLTRVQNDLQSFAPSSVQPAITHEQAVASFHLGVPGKIAGITKPVDLFYPSNNQLIHAYQFMVTTKGARGATSSYRVIYDAENPHVIKSWNTSVQ